LFEKIFAEYGTTAVAVLVFIAVIIGMFFPSLVDLHSTINNFINSFNN